jgi:hypothetical protein
MMKKERGKMREPKRVRRARINSFDISGGESPPTDELLKELLVFLSGKKNEFT